MKLLLVNPNFKGVVSVPSLGLGFIGTYVRENSNCEVEIVEPILQGLTEAQVLDKVKESDIVGLTCYTESRFQVFDFAAKAKQVNPDCKLIVGGPHVNTLGKQILQHYPFIDAYSAPFRPPIPEQIGHPFRLIPATNSGAFRPL